MASLQLGAIWHTAFCIIALSVLRFSVELSSMLVSFRFQNRASWQRATGRSAPKLLALNSGAREIVSPADRCLEQFRRDRLCATEHFGEDRPLRRLLDDQVGARGC